MSERAPASQQQPSRHNSRKEVKRYHQRQTSNALRVDAMRRDKNLFLFNNKTPTSDALHESSGALSSDTPPQQSTTTTTTTKALSTHSGGGGTSSSLRFDGNDDFDDWEFDFVFRPKANSSGGSDDVLLDAQDASACHQEAAVVPPSFYTEMKEAAATFCDCRQAALVSEMRVDSSSSPSPAACASPPPPSKKGSAGAAIYVHREEGVPPIPVTSPMAAGTDLNVPTNNYLALDPLHNIHQHAPGFQRDEATALRSLLSSAMAGCPDVRSSPVVLSTGDAMRSVFEQTYNVGKPLALKVQRIGPAIVIDSHSEAPSSVRGMREKALLGKALYRLGEEQPDVTTTTGDNKGDTKEPTTGEEAPAADGTVALRMQRVGSKSVTVKTASISRYSQLLRWDIDSLEVLVGVDTPIMLDLRDGTEQVLKLEDTTKPMTASEMQRDVLNCWFDATLANVPQVGLYIHNAGVVQHFEIKKVQELLGLVEGRIATSAMKFTSNVLQWLVKECARDGGTYAVIRGYDSDYLQLYEVPGQHNMFPDLLHEDDKATAGGHGAGDDADGSSATDSQANSAEHREENRRLNLNLARMCCGMGQHLFQEGNIAKSFDALSLLLRSFVIFIQQSDAPQSLDRICDIVRMLPPLIGRLIQQRQDIVSVPVPVAAAAATGGGGSSGELLFNKLSGGADIHSTSSARSRDPGLCVTSARRTSPDGFREALLTCGRFEARIRIALKDAALGPVVKRKYVRCLLPCCASLCVVVARSLEVFTAERLLCLRGSSCVTVDATPASRACTGRVEACSRMKDLLQVVVEGLVRLEQLTEMVRAFVNAQAKTAAPSSMVSAAVAAATSSSDVVVDSTCREEGVPQQLCGALLDPTTDVDVGPLHASLCELYGDVILLTMADPTSFTAKVLNEAGRQIVPRDGSEASAKTTTSTTTLPWLAALTQDPVSLSFTALRFYGKASAQSRRLLLKTGQVYYYVGLHHLQTDRYTKALEALHRAKSLFHASSKAKDEVAYGDCFTTAPLVTLEDVLKALGDVYSSMTALKVRVSASTSVARVTPHQPLCVGLLHAVSEEELKFCQQAMDHYMEGNWDSQKGTMMIQYTASHVENVALSGQPMDRPAALHLADLLAEVKSGSGGAAASTAMMREWTLLRIATATQLGQLTGGWVKEVQCIAQHWEKRLCVAAGNTAALSDLPVSAVEANLQLALLHCVCAEHVFAVGSCAGAKKIVPLHVSARMCVAFLIGAMNALADLGDDPPADHLAGVARVWGASSVEDWMYRMTTMIALRVLKTLAPASQSASERQQRSTTTTSNSAAQLRVRADAALAFRQILALEASRSAADKEDIPQQRLKALERLLSPCLSW